MCNFTNSFSFTSQTQWNHQQLNKNHSCNQMNLLNFLRARAIWSERLVSSFHFHFTQFHFQFQFRYNRETMIISSPRACITGHCVAKITSICRYKQLNKEIHSHGNEKLRFTHSIVLSRDLCANAFATKSKTINSLKWLGICYSNVSVRFHFYLNFISMRLTLLCTARK